MERTIRNIIKKHYGQDDCRITALGGGYYGRAFGVKINVHPFCLVVKLYLYPGLAEKESVQIKELSKHSILKMPEIYGYYAADNSDLSYDVVLMEYLEGVNAGDVDVSTLSSEAKECICESIVDNLIAIHSTVNKSGFGELTDDHFYNTWQEFYRPKAHQVVLKAQKLHSVGQITDRVLNVFEKSYNSFDEILHLPITEAKMIHGDYNTWNIMLDCKKSTARYCIDPFGCCYGDSEYDLYQLDNANGKEFGLLDRYASKVPLSENFEAKKAFYKLYSEIGHYHDAHVMVDQEAAEQMAKELSLFL